MSTPRATFTIIRTGVRGEELLERKGFRGIGKDLYFAWGWW